MNSAWMTIQNKPPPTMELPPQPGASGLFLQDPTGCLLGRHHQPHQTVSTPPPGHPGPGRTPHPAVADRDSPVSPPMSITPPHPGRRCAWPTFAGRQLLRKEVIQPHLPVRLPCYDFVPIASPTFDGSLPDGLGHRLRVLPTFVT